MLQSYNYQTVFYCQKTDTIINGVELRARNEPANMWKTNLAPTKEPKTYNGE